MSKDHRLPDGRERVRAHDMRHLCLCGICGGIADQRAAISYNAAYRYTHIAAARKDPDVFWHPACCFEELGEKFVLDLPVSEQKKFCLCDVPVSTMRKLVDEVGED